MGDAMRTAVFCAQLYSMLTSMLFDQALGVDRHCNVNLSHHIAAGTLLL